MYGSFGEPSVDRILITYGPWLVRELRLDHQKLEWLWAEMQKYPSLFSDLTQHNENVFLDMIEDKFTYFLEIINDNEETVGLFYVTELYKGIDASVHLLFFDRKPSEKAELCKEILLHVFDKFPYLHRLTATIPSIYHATIRLAKRIGFVQEGTKRQSLMIKHKWCDEVIFGTIAGELNGIA